MSETWKDIAGWEGMYQCSDYGNIRSLDRTVEDVSNGRLLRYKGRVLKPSATRGGYLQVLLSRDGCHFNTSIHRTVLETFVGRCPEGMVACHSDGNQKNNVLSNLRWDTQSNNVKDRVAHGTSDRGERNSQSKLTEAQILEIRSRLASRVKGTGRRLASEYRVSASTISAISVGKRWSWL